MDKIKILVACHKPGSVRHDDVYTPIHVGRAISKYKEEMSDMIGDDTGDNISEKNPFYSEMTAQYWAWKNLHDVEYIGFCHYRRFFEQIITSENIDSLLDNHDVLLLGYKRVEIIERFTRSVTPEDLTIFMMVLKKMHPEYEQTVIDYLWGNKLYHKNMLVCRKVLFDQYATWIFNIFSECEKYIRISPYNRGKRVYAYLAEIFMPVFFLHNHCRILNTRVIETEEMIRPKFVDDLRNVFKDVCFIFTVPFMRKPKSFEDYYTAPVLVGLKNDGIII